LKSSATSTRTRNFWRVVIPEQDAEILQLPQRQIARINGIRLNLSAMSDLELMVLESQVSDRFIEVHSELEVVRRALAERRSNDSSDDQLSPATAHIQIRDVNYVPRQVPTMSCNQSPRGPPLGG
jgi:hypothetical protein